MKKMVSEDSSNILALIIVTFSFISVPILLFLLAVMIYFNVQYAVQFYNRNDLTDAVIAISLAIANIVLVFVIRALTKWLRK